MKSLNRKTGTIALAGIVVAGGVAVSGLSAYANSSFSPSQNRDIQKVEFYCKDSGIVKVMESEKELNNSVNGYSRSIIANNGKLIKVNNVSQVPVQIRDAKRYNKKFLKIECHNVYYLIEVK